MKTRSIPIFVVIFAFGLLAAPESNSQQKHKEESVDSLLKKLESKKADERLEAVEQFERILDGWAGSGANPIEWEKWRMNDLCRALCDSNNSVRYAAAGAFIKITRRKVRSIEPADYLIKAIQLKFEDPLLVIAIKSPDNGKLRNSVKATSAATLAVIYKQNAAALPALESEAKKDSSLTGAAGRLATIQEVQRRIRTEVRPILIELRTSEDKELSGVAEKVLKVIDAK